MPKKILRKMTPNPDWIKNHQHLQFFGDKLHDPNFWHFNRRSIAKAFAIGLFACWIPVPGQMLLAASAALFYRANLPVSLMLVWVSNPITIPPLFYFAYRTGLLLLQRTAPTSAFDFSIEGLMSSLSNTWEPFLVGCLVLASLSSCVGYFGINALWRYSVIKKWTARKTN